LFADTGVSLDAKILGQNLNFQASIGPLGIYIVKGSALLNRDGNAATTDPATFTVGLAPKPGGYHFSDLSNLSGIVNVGLVGAANLSLPLFFPTPTYPLGGDATKNTLTIAIGDLSNIASTTTVQTPDISDLFGSLD